MLYQIESVSDVFQGTSSVNSICVRHCNESNENYNLNQNQDPLSNDCEISGKPIRSSKPYIWLNHPKSLALENPEKFPYQQQHFGSNHSENDAPLVFTPILEQESAFGNLWGNSFASHISEFNTTQTQLQHEPMTNDLLAPNSYYSMAKNHRAHIKLVASSGNFKAIVKRKRKRTIFSTEQIASLEELFARKSYITREDRQVLVNQLQISDKSIKVWFQNRRLKGKREQESAFSDSQTEDRSSPDIARLDYVESQINKKTDEFGYVTLDDAVMSDLVNVIDNFLAKSNNLDASTTTTNEIRESSPIYEPISPASLSDCANEEENSHHWEPYEPKESLQKLFDLQTMFSNYEHFN